MTREHRVLEDGEITVVPFTPEEEIIADQQDADALAAEILFNSDEERYKRSFVGTDVARVIFEAFFEIGNRVQVLEGKQPITRDQLKTWLKNKLP